MRIRVLKDTHLVCKFGNGWAGIGRRWGYFGAGREIDCVGGERPIRRATKPCSAPCSIRLTLSLDSFVFLYLQPQSVPMEEGGRVRIAALGFGTRGLRNSFGSREAFGVRVALA